MGLLQRGQRAFSALVVCLALSSAEARPRLLVLAQGDCRDPDLITDLRALNRMLSHRDERAVLSEEDFRKIVGAPPERGVAELQLQLEAGRSAHYGGQWNRALELVDDVLRSARSLPPDPDRWTLVSEAEAVRFMALTAKGLHKNAISAFRNIVRIAPNHALDPGSYAPKTRKILEQVREEVAHATKGMLQVTSNPSDLVVYLEGVPAGKTPATLTLLPGAYQVTLGKGGMLSLPHDVAVISDQKSSMTIDFELESALPHQRFACLHVPLDPKRRVALGVKMGNWVGVDEVVLLSLEKPEIGAGMLRATLVELGTSTVTRDGAIKVLPGRENPEGLEDLSVFVATGNAGRNVLSLQQFVPTPLSVSTSSTSPSLKRPLLWTLGGIAAVSLVGGTVLEVMAHQSAARFDRAYQGPGPLPGDLRDLVSLRTASRTQHTWALAAFGVAAAATGVGVATYFLGGQVPSPGAAPRLSAGVGSVSLSGTWP